MKITRLRALQYRNYPSLLIEPTEGVTLLLGDNAQGKTNLLEAIALMSTGRSHRTRSDRDLVRIGQEEAAVRVHVEHKSAAHEIEMRLYASASAHRKVLINGAPISRTGELLGYLNAVLFTPEDLRLVKEGPQERRRFLDMELSQAIPGYYYALQRYLRILKQRNALLKRIAIREGLRETLDTWDEQLCAVAPEIHRRRADFCERLRVVAGERHRDIAAGGEELEVSYLPSPGGEGDFARAMLEALHAAREDDIRRGITSVGPHRDDLLLRIQGRDSRLYASQGQQRTAALSLKLSELQLMQEQTGEWPLLLLDDVMSELDARRRDALLGHMQGVQTFITAAVDGAPLPVGARVYRVREGRIE